MLTTMMMPLVLAQLKRKNKLKISMMLMMTMMTMISPLRRVAIVMMIAMTIAMMRS